MSITATGSSVSRGVAALRANPLRTTLSALGVVIGVGAMISVLALSDGVERSVRDQLAQDGRLLTVRVSPRTSQLVDGQPVPRTGYPVFTLADAAALERALGPAAAQVNLTVAGAALVRVEGATRERGAMLRGVRAIPAALLAKPLTAGRTLSTSEIATGARVLVVGDELAAALAASRVGDVDGAAGSASEGAPPVSLAACRALVGARVQIRDVPWTVVGVLAPRESASPGTGCGAPATATALGDSAAATRNGSAARLTAYAPATAAPQAFLPGGSPPAPELVVTAAGVERMAEVAAIAERWAAVRVGGAPGRWRGEVQVASYAAESDAARRGILMFKLLMGAITGVSLVVGGVGIMNVLLASVTERTREIGISKAVGARRRDVLLQFLAEAVAISGLGAVLGTALGFGVAQLVAALMRQQTAMPVQAGFSPATLLVAVGAPLVVGLAFGIYPALRAARLSPIDAIRHE